MLGLSGHVLWNGVQYVRGGELTAGPLLIVSAAVGLAAIVGDLRA